MVHLNDDNLIWFDIELTHLCYEVKGTLLGNWEIEREGGREGVRDLMEKNISDRSLPIRKSPSEL